MIFNYTPLKLAVLVTPHFIAVPVIVFLIDILNVSPFEIAILTAIGVVFGVYYLIIVAYASSQRKILKLVVPVLAVSVPLALALQHVIQLALKYDSLILILWVFLVTLIVGWSYEIYKTLKDVGARRESSKVENLGQ